MRVSHCAQVFSTQLLPRPSRPHLMSIEIAKRRGQEPMRKAGSAQCPPSFGIAALAVYLAGRKQDRRTGGPRSGLAGHRRFLRLANGGLRGASTSPQGEARLVGENGSPGRFQGATRVLSHLPDLLAIVNPAPTAVTHDRLRNPTKQRSGLSFPSLPTAKKWVIKGPLASANPHG